MYSIIDISRYIINAVNANWVINLPKLHYVLFYLQSIYLCEMNEPLFLEDYQVCQGNLIYPTVQNEFQKYGNRSIPYQNKYYEKDTSSDFGFTLHFFDNNKLSINVRAFIDVLLPIFQKYSTVTLRQNLFVLPNFTSHFKVGQNLPKEKLQSEFQQYKRSHICKI